MSCAEILTFWLCYIFSDRGGSLLCKAAPFHLWPVSVLEITIFDELNSNCMAYSINSNKWYIPLLLVLSSQQQTENHIFLLVESVSNTWKEMPLLPIFHSLGQTSTASAPHAFYSRTSSSFTFPGVFTQRNLNCLCHSQSVTFPLFKEKTDLQSGFGFTFYTIHVKI